MANHFRVQVHESRDQLEHRLQRASTASSRERLQMLYWIKTKAIATRQELAQRLGRNESTVYRWLQRYAQGGIAALLEVKTAPGKASKLTPAAMEQLQRRLANPKGFKSYGQIQRWLKRQHGIVLAYKSVHHLVRYKLKAKLKVPRPRSAKASPVVQAAFKKNLAPSFE